MSCCQTSPSQLGEIKALRGQDLKRCIRRGGMVRAPVKLQMSTERRTPNLIHDRFKLRLKTATKETMSTIQKQLVVPGGLQRHQMIL